MCGILACIKYNNNVINSNIDEATNFLDKRGPDFTGKFQFELFDSSITLVHTRLSIIDLSAAANQPFKSIDGKWSIIFNGEIYNYKEIKSELIVQGYKFVTDSDTEVIINSFDKWGIKSIDRFIGMFSFVICNHSNGNVFIVRDRTGVKPLYYEYNKAGINISSDLNSLMKLSRKTKEDVNYSAIPLFLKYGYLSSSNNFINGINKLEPGSYIDYNIKNNKFQIQKYWNPLSSFQKNKRKYKSDNDILVELEELLVSACEYRMVSDVPVGIFLSGGYDSSLVTALLAKSGKYDLNTFSIGFENSEYDESEYARSIANHLGVNFNKYICTESDAISIIPNLVKVYDEPFGDSSAIPTLLVSELASNNVKVVLSADGGDEVFGGYTKYTSSLNSYYSLKKVPDFILKGINKIPKKLLHKPVSYLLGKNLNETHMHKFGALLTSKNVLEFNDVMGSLNYSFVYKELFKKQSEKSFLDEMRFNEISHFDDLNSMLIYDYMVYLEADILRKVDRATMYHSIEGREPLLDHRVYEYVANLPNDFKIRNNIQKYILKELTHKYISKNLMDRPKKGFGLPLNDWCHKNKDLKQLFFDTLNEKSIKKLSILKIKEVELLKNKFLEDGNSHFVFLWYLFNYIRWFEEHFD
jgi:asparagine synthase (glutamine-hydrolysing)